MINHSQRKKDKSDSPNEIYLETRNIAKEEIKLGHMFANVDNHADKLK